MVEDELTGTILKVFYKVYNTLGHGFIESIYHNAMVLELVESGCEIETEKPIAVTYNDRLVGTFAPDIVVNDKVILELKAKERIVEAHEAQLVNYLRATEIEVGLLLNFGRSPEFKRKYFSNENKKRRVDTTSLLDSLLIKDPS
jgi:GxxExxY protein